MIISRTPYRISFFGGGTDYPEWYRLETGAVLSTTIDKYCYITCRHLPPFFPHRSRIVYSRVETVREIDEIQHASVRNVLRLLRLDEGVEIHHDGDVPARSGLGTSSTFTVGLLHALYRLRGEQPGRMQLAQEAIHVERDMNAENVGSQDQVAAAIGGLNRIEFGPGDKIAPTRIHVDHHRVIDLQDHLMLCFTGISRNATAIAEEQIRNTPRRRHELQDMAALVDEAISVLSGQGPITELGPLLQRSWMLKKRLSSMITTPAIDDLYERAMREGAHGGKLLGAGGGGFLLLLVEPDRQPRLREILSDLVHIDFRFEDQGSHIILDQPTA